MRMADALMLMVWNRSCMEVARIPLRSGVIRLLLFCESMVREAHCTSAYAASPSPQAMVMPPLKLTSSDTEYSVTNTGITPICHTNNSRAILPNCCADTRRLWHKPATLPRISPTTG